MNTRERRKWVKGDIRGKQIPLLVSYPLSFDQSLWPCSHYVLRHLQFPLQSGQVVTEGSCDQGGVSFHRNDPSDETHKQSTGEHFLLSAISQLARTLLDTAAAMRPSYQGPVIVP